MASFSIVTMLQCREGSNTFPCIALLTLGPYLIMLGVKQGSSKYHFFSFWYDPTWDLIPVSRTIGKHSNHHANRSLYIDIYI